MWTLGSKFFNANLLCYLFSCSWLVIIILFPSLYCLDDSFAWRSCRTIVNEFGIANFL